jgi:hypothetical protein
MDNGFFQQCSVCTLSGALLVAAMYYLFRLG